MFVLGLGKVIKSNNFLDTHFCAVFKVRTQLALRT